MDDEPHRQVEDSRSRVLSEGRLRQSVMRDIAWLLSTTNWSAAPPTDPQRQIAFLPEVATSVLNFGILDLVGRPDSSLQSERNVELERLLRQAILDFEPRIRRNSLRVERLDPGDEEEAIQRVAHGHCLVFRIEGELVAHPVQLHLLLEATLDVENGDAQVVEATAKAR